MPIRFRSPSTVWMFALLAPLAVLVTPANHTAEPADREFLHIGGTLGTDPTSGELVAGVTGQVRQAMENIGATLHAQGMDFTRVVSANVFLSDTRHFAEMNEVYRSYFPREPPTRATVSADIPMVGAAVQISVVAARPGVPRRVIEPNALKSPELPYSWGILAGNTLFIAGATSRDPATYQPVTGGIATQTRRVFGNIGAVLEAADMAFTDLASCTVFMDDPREFGPMNAAYREFVGEDPPARATVRAGLMNPAFKVEIQCVAERGANRAVVVAAGASRPRSPYSPAIHVGDRVYTAGMVGSGPAGVAKGDIEAQTRQTLSNLRATLQAAGMEFENVHAIHMWLPHIVHTGTANAVLDEVIGDAASRTVIGADLMGPDFLVEIMMFGQSTNR